MPYERDLGKPPPNSHPAGKTYSDMADRFHWLAVNGMSIGFRRKLANQEIGVPRIAAKLAKALMMTVSREKRISISCNVN